MLADDGAGNVDRQATALDIQAALQELLGSRIPIHNVLFETDFPHPTCLFDNVEDKLSRSLARLDEAQRRRVLWDNAAELYRIET